MTPTSEELLAQIRNQITAYQMNVKSDNKAHRYNINDRAEAFSIPLLKLIFGWDQLQDLNRISTNYPGIDLGDYKNRVAVQVTSDTSFDKVKRTITQFVGNALYDDFDRLLILMIQERNQKYNQKTIDTLCEGRLRFDQENDVLDFSYLMQFIKGLLVPDLNKVLWACPDLVDTENVAKYTKSGAERWQRETIGSIRKRSNWKLWHC